MAYSTLDDIKKSREADLIALTDDTNTGEINEDIVEAAIAKADAEIDASLAVRYALPLESCPQLLTRISASIALYHLFVRKTYDIEMFKTITKQYEACQELLAKIREGVIIIGCAEKRRPPGMHAL